MEGFRRHLAAALDGRRVTHVNVDDAGVLRNTTAPSFRRRVTGRTFGRARRIGKWLILPTDGPVLLVHSGMTGRPAVTGVDDEVAQFVRLRITLDEGELRYQDLRKLRGVWLARDDDDAARIVGPIGPDALDLDLDTFRSVLTNRRGAAKPTLTNQEVIAGLGNMLADEICWRARIRPSRALADLDAHEVRDLHTAMRQILRTSVRHGCVPSLRGWLTTVRNDADPHCPRCGTRLRRSRVGGRTTLWCPRDQSR